MYVACYVIGHTKRINILLQGTRSCQIQNLPFLVVHGEADDTYSYDAARTNAETLKSRGLPVEFLSVPGGTHLEAWCDALPQILDFFDKHRKL